jgi:hypothetical protein
VVFSTCELVQKEEEEEEEEEARGLIRVGTG